MKHNKTLLIFCFVFQFIALSYAQGQSASCSFPVRKKADAKASTKPSCPQNELETAPSKLTKLVDDYWNWKLNEYPEGGTWYGFHDYGDRLTNNSIEANNERYKSVLKFLERIEKIEPCITSLKDVQNLNILKYGLTSFKEGHSFNGYYLVIDNIWGPEKYFPLILGRMPLKTLEDYENLISRLNHLPEQLSQTITLLRAGVKAGITQHELSIKGLNESISGLMVKDASSSVFYKYFKENFPTSFTPENISDLQSRALTIVRDKVLPAFDKLRKYLFEEYKTRKNISISSLPNGPAIYQRLIRVHTSSNFTAKEIFDIGNCEVKRIGEKMKQIGEELGYDDMTLSEINKVIIGDQKNYFSTNSEILKGYEAIIKEIDAQLPALFKKLPSAAVIVEADNSPTATGAYYKSASIDGKTPGTFVVGTYNPKSQPKYSMMTLTLHEANPGHHLQLSLALEGDLPLFRKTSLGSSYSASGFGSSSFYVEGWALYAEALGLDLNMYDDPLDLFGHYTYEMLRACRLVVDTGMHALGWTKEQAIDFMVKNMASDRESIESEVNRYITWPGQALAYKMGQMRIQEMRKNAEEKLGNAFDLKEFHDIVLSIGQAPLDVVEDEVNRYIDITLDLKT